VTDQAIDEKQATCWGGTPLPGSWQRAQDVECEGRCRLRSLDNNTLFLHSSIKSSAACTRLTTDTPPRAPLRTPCPRSRERRLIRTTGLPPGAAVTSPIGRGYCRRNPGTSRTHSESARKRGAWRNKHSESPRKRGGPSRIVRPPVFTFLHSRTPTTYSLNIDRWKGVLLLVRKDFC